MSDRRPIDLDGSDAFFEYVIDLRETASFDPKHVCCDDNANTNFSTMATSSDSDDELSPTNRQMQRRTFMIATALAAGSAAGIGTAAGQEINDGSALNFDSELTPDPQVSTDALIQEAAVSGSALEYTNNDGDDVSLEDVGGGLAARPEEDQPHNPVSFAADELQTAAYEDFPRGEWYDENSDGDEETAVSALDATHWSTTAAEAAVSDYSPASGGMGIVFDASGVADGTEAGIRFEDVEIDSGELRKYLQVGMTPVVLEGTMEIRVEDSTGATTTVVVGGTDPDFDPAIGEASVYQSQLGDLASDIDTITALEVVAVSGDAEAEIFALDLDSESTWSFGRREFLDEDDEVDDEEVEMPAGEIEIISMDSVGDDFSDAEIDQLRASTEISAGRGPETEIEYDLTDPSNPAYDERIRMIASIELPSAFDLSYEGLDVEIENNLGDQFATVEVGGGYSDPQGLEDYGDLDLTDVTSDIEAVESGEWATVLSEPDVDAYVVTYIEADLTSAQVDELESGGVVGFLGGGGGGGGGILSGPRAVIGGAIVGAVGFVASKLGMISSLLGR